MEIKLSQEDFEKQLLDYLNLVRKALKLKKIKKLPAYSGKTLDQLVAAIVKETELLKFSWAGSHGFEVKITSKTPFKNVDEINNLVAKYTKKRFKHFGEHIGEISVYGKEIDLSFDITYENTFEQLYTLMSARLV